LWNNPRSGGHETRVFTVDGDQISALVNGQDDRNRATYSGSMRGTITGRNLSTTRALSTGKGWEKLTLSEDGTVLKGNAGDLGDPDPWNDVVCTR
jgi:hypothetical protein